MCVVKNMSRNMRGVQKASYQFSSRIQHRLTRRKTDFSETVDEKIRVEHLRGNKGMKYKCRG